MTTNPAPPQCRYCTGILSYDTGVPSPTPEDLANGVITFPITRPGHVQLHIPNTPPDAH